MIHTAEEIIYEYGYMDGGQFSSKHVTEMINKARIEAIKECISIAKIEPVDPWNLWVRDYEDYFKVSEEPFQKLLDQIK